MQARRQKTIRSSTARPAHSPRRTFCAMRRRARGTPHRLPTCSSLCPCAPFVHAGQPICLLHALACAYAPLSRFPIPSPVPAAIPSIAWLTFPTSASGVICVFPVYVCVHVFNCQSCSVCLSINFLFSGIDYYSIVPQLCSLLEKEFNCLHYHNFHYVFSLRVIV